MAAAQASAATCKTPFVDRSGRLSLRARSERLNAGFGKAGSFDSQALLGLKALPSRFSSRSPVSRISAVAAPVAAPDLHDPEERKRLAEAYGFTKIGEPVPKEITLKQVIDSIPAEAFEINEWKSFSHVFISLISMAVAEVAIYYSPWFLLPLAWAFAGTAFTGFFVVGHDCAHKSFSKNKFVEDLVGTLMFMPLVYPYEPWRIKHDRHHAKTNMLVGDTAWHPVMPSEYAKMDGGAKAGIQVGMGPLRFLASIGHWLLYHFDLKKFRQSEIPRVKISLAAVTAFAVVGFPLIIANFGLTGFISLWLMPWLGFHFWMSTFTMVHHTAPHIPFRSVGEWNSAEAQLGGTVHCVYPRWVEILCHDINVHIPHHVASRIPSYNLRMAYDAIRAKYEPYVNEATWNWRLMKTIFTQCHLYDEEKNYLAFDAREKAESPILAAVRKLMPPFKTA